MFMRLLEISWALFGSGTRTMAALILAAFLMSPAMAQTAPAVEESKSEAKVEQGGKSDGKTVASVATEPEKATLDDVKDSIGKKVVLEYEVKSSSLIESKKICFLNSRKNYRDKQNFAVIIKSDSLERFAMAEIVNPAKHFLNKKIRVSGMVTEHRGKPQIQVTMVDQIKVLKPKPDEEASEEQAAAQTVR